MPHFSQTIQQDLTRVTAELLAAHNPYALDTTEKSNTLLVTNTLLYIVTHLDELKKRVRVPAQRDYVPEGNPDKYVYIHLIDIKPEAVSQQLGINIGKIIIKANEKAIMDEYIEARMLVSLVQTFIDCYELVKAESPDTVKAFCSRFTGNCIDARTRVAFDYAFSFTSKLTFKDLMELAQTAMNVDFPVDREIKTPEQAAINAANEIKKGNYFLAIAYIIKSVWGKSYKKDSDNWLADTHGVLNSSQFAKIYKYLEISGYEVTHDLIDPKTEQETLYDFVEAYAILDEQQRFHFIRALLFDEKLTASEKFLKTLTTHPSEINQAAHSAFIANLLIIDHAYVLQLYENEETIKKLLRLNQLVLNHAQLTRAFAPSEPRVAIMCLLCLTANLPLPPAVTQMLEARMFEPSELVTMQTTSGRTLLIFVANFYDQTLAMRILNNCDKPKLVTACQQQDIENNNALHTLAKNTSHVQLVSFILSKLSNETVYELLKQQNIDDQTPLHVAVLSNQTKVFNIFYKNFSANNAHLQSIFQLRDIHKKTIIDYMIEKTNWSEELHKVISVLFTINPNYLDEFMLQAVTREDGTQPEMVLPYLARTRKLDLLNKWVELARNDVIDASVVAKDIHENSLLFSLLAAGAMGAAIESASSHIILKASKKQLDQVVGSGVDRASKKKLLLLLVEKDPELFNKIIRKISYPVFKAEFTRNDDIADAIMKTDTQQCVKMLSELIVRFPLIILTKNNLNKYKIYKTFSLDGIPSIQDMVSFKPIKRQSIDFEKFKEFLISVIPKDMNDANEAIRLKNIIEHLYKQDILQNERNIVLAACIRVNILCYDLDATNQKSYLKQILQLTQSITEWKQFAFWDKVEIIEFLLKQLSDTSLSQLQYEFCYHTIKNIFHSTSTEDSPLFYNLLIMVLPRLSDDIKINLLKMLSPHDFLMDYYREHSIQKMLYLKRLLVRVPSEYQLIFLKINYPDYELKSLLFSQLTQDSLMQISELLFAISKNNRLEFFNTYLRDEFTINNRKISIAILTNSKQSNSLEQLRIFLSQLAAHEQFAFGCTLTLDDLFPKPYNKWFEFAKSLSTNQLNKLLGTDAAWVKFIKSKHPWIAHDKEQNAATLEVMKYLLQNGNVLQKLLPRTTDDDLKTLIAKVLENEAVGFVEKIESLHEQYPNTFLDEVPLHIHSYLTRASIREILHYVDEHGQTLLHKPTFDLALVEGLLSQEDLEDVLFKLAFTQDNKGQTPLHVAAQNNNISLLEFLITYVVKNVRYHPGGINLLAIRDHSNRTASEYYFQNNRNQWQILTASQENISTEFDIYDDANWHSMIERQLQSNQLTLVHNHTNNPEHIRHLHNKYSLRVTETSVRWAIVDKDYHDHAYNIITYLANENTLHSTKATLLRAILNIVPKTNLQQILLRTDQNNETMFAYVARNHQLLALALLMEYATPETLKAASQQVDKNGNHLLLAIAAAIDEGTYDVLAHFSLDKRIDNIFSLFSTEVIDKAIPLRHEQNGQYFLIMLACRNPRIFSSVVKMASHEAIEQFVVASNTDLIEFMKYNSAKLSYEDYEIILKALLEKVPFNIFPADPHQPPLFKPYEFLQSRHSIYYPIQALLRDLKITDERLSYTFITAMIPNNISAIREPVRLLEILKVVKKRFGSDIDLANLTILVNFAAANDDKAHKDRYIKSAFNFERIKNKKCEEWWEFEAFSAMLFYILNYHIAARSLDLNYAPGKFPALALTTNLPFNKKQTTHIQNAMRRFFTNELYTVEIAEFIKSLNGVEKYLLLSELNLYRKGNVSSSLYYPGYHFYPGSLLIEYISSMPKPIDAPQLEAQFNLTELADLARLEMNTNRAQLLQDSEARTVLLPIEEMVAYALRLLDTAPIFATSHFAVIQQVLIDFHNDRTRDVIIGYLLAQLLSHRSRFHKLADLCFQHTSFNNSISAEAMLFFSRYAYNNEDVAAFTRVLNLIILHLRESFKSGQFIHIMYTLRSEELKQQFMTIFSKQINAGLKDNNPEYNYLFPLFQNQLNKNCFAFILEYLHKHNFPNLFENSDGWLTVMHYCRLHPTEALNKYVQLVGLRKSIQIMRNMRFYMFPEGPPHMRITSSQMSMDLIINNSEFFQQLKNLLGENFYKTIAHPTEIKLININEFIAENQEIDNTALQTPNDVPLPVIEEKTFIPDDMKEADLLAQQQVVPAPIPDYDDIMLATQPRSVIPEELLKKLQTDPAFAVREDCDIEAIQKIESTRLDATVAKLDAQKSLLILVFSDKRENKNSPARIKEFALKVEVSETAGSVYLNFIDSIARYSSLAALCAAVSLPAPFVSLEDLLAEQKKLQQEKGEYIKHKRIITLTGKCPNTIKDDAKFSGKTNTEAVDIIDREIKLLSDKLQALQVNINAFTAEENSPRHKHKRK